MNTNMKHLLLILTFSTLVTACGGGKDAKTNNGSTSSNSSQQQFNPLKTAANATFSGTIAFVGTLPLNPITVYDKSGKQCGTGTSNASGDFSIAAKCIFPVLLSADTPELQGKVLFSVVPTISQDSENVRINITPFTSALVSLVNNGLPTSSTPLDAVKASKQNVDIAHDKLRQLLKPMFIALSMPDSPDFQAGVIEQGKGQDALLDQLKITFERIPSTNQNVLKLTLASENRPITLVQDTKDPASIRVDAGLGITPDTVDPIKLANSKEAVNQISKLLNNNSSADIESKIDQCYLHNGFDITKYTKETLFNARMPWEGISPVATNIRLLRYNTRVNFENTTEENANTGTGDLAYISFDYRTPRGALDRAYTWVVKGSQIMKDGCFTTGDSWRIVGNQRNIYVQSSTYALHKIEFNSTFSGRTDTYGSGLEFVLGDNDINYVYALITGPGLPADGVTYIKTDGSYLVSSSSPLSIRQAVSASMRSKTIDDINLNPRLHLKSIFDTVTDTRSVLLSDSDIYRIQDTFYGNTYIVRLYSRYDDLYPSVTIEDILPKKPQLDSDMIPAAYPSVSVNLDQLITALQVPGPVQINWSLPKDSRNLPLQSYMVGFQRKNCADENKWPNCNKRSDQINEYMLSKTFMNKDTISTPLVIDKPVTLGAKTFQGSTRVFVIDTLNRPLEVSIGMTYLR
jgi:hypothetical protein